MFNHDSPKKLYQMSKRILNVCCLLHTLHVLSISFYNYLLCFITMCRVGVSLSHYSHCTLSDSCLLAITSSIPSEPTQTPSPTPAPTSSSPATTPTTSIPDTPTEESGDEPKKIQSDTTRCWSCNKKVGLLGFKCRCEYVFCSMHRYSDKHACPFDYKAMQKANLQKANPVIKGAKVEKI